MSYINCPIAYKDSGAGKHIIRDINDDKEKLDNLVELIVFTPRGSFFADPDFGFEYWNHEYSNVHYREFNNGQTGMSADGLYNEITKKECQDSILRSLADYAPYLKQASVSIELNSADIEQQLKKKVPSKYFVVITVSGYIDDGLGTTCLYKKNIVFLMEPTAKKYRI